MAEELGRHGRRSDQETGFDRKPVHNRPKPREVPRHGPDAEHRLRRGQTLGVRRQAPSQDLQTLLKSPNRGLSVKISRIEQCHRPIAHPAATTIGSHSGTPARSVLLPDPSNKGCSKSLQLNGCSRPIWRRQESWLENLLRLKGPFAPLARMVFDHDLRVCRGNRGTLFALIRRHDLNLKDMLLPVLQPQE